MLPSRVPALLLAAALAAVAAPLPGQDKKPPAPTVEELVADLGDPAYAAREKAQRELWTRGDEAIPALEKVLGGDNPEVVRRARELLDKFAWGIRPDTPPAVMKLLKRYQAGDADPQKSAEVRKAAILELLRHGPPGLSVVKALLGKPLTEEARAQLLSQFTGTIRREVPLRLFDGKGDEAADLIALHAAGTGPEGAADYAAFQVLRESLPAATAAAEAGLKLGKNAATHRLVLAHLYRSNGDWPRAVAVAAQLPRVPDEPPLGDALREEAGDWGKLADNGYGTPLNYPEAVRLSLLRLAGREKAFDEAAREVVKAANEFSSADEIQDAVVALFANHRAADATRILLERKQSLGLLGETLIQGLRYKDALALAGPAKEMSAKEKLDLDLRRARVLMLTGRRDDAVQLFGSVFNGMRAAGEGRGANLSILAIRSLLRTEVRVGLKDLAAEHAARFVADGTFARTQASATGETAFEILFNQDATAATVLFDALRAAKVPGDEPGPTMIRVRELLTGKANKAAVDQALKAVRDHEEIYSTEGRPPTGSVPAAPGPSSQFVSGQQLAIAAVCRAAGRDADAEAAFKSAADAASDTVEVAGVRSWVYGTSDAFRPYVEWGDFLSDRGRFRDAAERYLEGWKKFPDQPLPLFLSGKALVAAGDVKEGERRVELSHWVALGQERTRGRFLDELVRRGEGRAAKRETALILRACWCRDHYFGNVMNQAAKASVLVKDFATAEKCTQRSLLVLLKTQGMYFVEAAGYMVVPHEILTHRARALLAAGKVDEAVRVARETLAVTPGNVSFVSGMVADLDRVGRKAEADELFGTAWKAYEKLLTEFPDSPDARNGLAALSANCRRDADKGLRYAKEAVAAHPGSVGYRETLAEAHFRKGDREKAIEVMTTLAADDPRNRFYRRQIARYQSGTFDSPRPDTVD